MDHFVRRDGHLFAENVPLEQIARDFGTPTYVYSRATITRHVRVLREALGQLDHIICYAVKANANLAVLDVMRELGCSFDAVSVGELARIVAVGADTSRAIFSGVGKRDDEIRAALKHGILYICAESREEITAISTIAKELGTTAPVGVRVNPDVDAKTHPYIATGLRKNKFGVPISQAPELYKWAQSLPNIALVGVSCHIGSQITELEPFEEAATHLVTLAAKLKAAGAPLKYLGLGGGLGIPYNDETPPSPAIYGEALAKICGELDFTVVFEPGRVIVGNAGILLTRVVRQKAGAQNDFVIVDAGMNDLIRPALYDADHRMETVIPSEDRQQPAAIVGPVCESADTFDADSFVNANSGDLIAIRSAGAYGFVMASTYNGRPRPAEVLCDGDKALLVRERDDLADLWRSERRLDGSPPPGSCDF